MTTTPNMSLVLPTDHGSSDTWDVILDTVFGLVDAHDHSAGKGVQVPMGGLKVDADLSFSFGGVSRAITNLRAIDFSAQRASDMTALAGALFLSDGSGGLAVNELYYRTTGGANVKVTNGASLNVAGFSGGIGGDYSAAGALVDFIDATDTYRFRQQLGGGVQQYARMQSADLDLFEFKANPAAGVPANRVRLARPAALAANYTLTFPGALPSGQAAVQVSAGGVLTFVVPPQRQFPASLAGANGGATLDGLGRLNLLNATSDQPLPLIMNVGETLTSWSAFIIKNSNGTHAITARAWKVNLTTGARTAIGAAQSTSAAGPGAQVTLSLAGLSEVVATGFSYFITVTGDGVVTGDDVTGYQVTVA